MAEDWVWAGAHKGKCRLTHMIGETHLRRMKDLTFLPSECSHLFSLLCYAYRISPNSWPASEDSRRTGPLLPRLTALCYPSLTSLPVWASPCCRSILLPSTIATSVLSLCCSLGIGYALHLFISKKGH